MKYFFVLLPAFLLSCMTAPQSQVPRVLKPSVNELMIFTDSQIVIVNRDGLLKSPNLKTVVVKNDPTYPKRTMTYSAVPVTSLFRDVKISPNQTLIFSSRDGFSAPISPERLLNTNPKKAIAYIAIEDRKAPWPTLKNSKETAGPFYLIWENPERSKIGTEEWPYQLVGFQTKESADKEFPLTVPDVKSSSDVKVGYGLFMKNCFACHTMNGQGASQVGPDLNMPYSPTEYMNEKYLKTLIRNPQSLRHWPQAKMRGFSAAMLPDSDVEKIIAYLKQMVKQRAP